MLFGTNDGSRCGMVSYLVSFPIFLFSIGILRAKASGVDDTDFDPAS